MKRVRLIAIALTLAVLGVVASRVTAQESNVSEKTFLTFSGAVEMPGVTLEPGTYVFKLADSPSRNVVEVWDQDQKHMIGHWNFVQAERSRVTDENVVMFKETREGATPAVQFWYFPNEKIGKEFIYPKDQADRIAARTGVKVRSDESIVAAAEDPASVQGEPSADAALKDAPAPAQPTAAAGSLAGNRPPAPEPAAEPVAAPEPEPAPAVVAEVQSPAPAPAPAAPAVTSQAETPSRAVGTSGQANELPRTASPLALSGLLGLLSLTGAAGLRRVRT